MTVCIDQVCLQECKISGMLINLWSIKRRVAMPMLCGCVYVVQHRTLRTTLYNTSSHTLKLRFLFLCAKLLLHVSSPLSLLSASCVTLLSISPHVWEHNMKCSLSYSYEFCSVGYLDRRTTPKRTVRSTATQLSRHPMQPMH